MSVFQPLISEYIGRKVKYDIRVPVFSKTNTNNFEDFQGLNLYCFEWLSNTNVKFSDSQDFMLTMQNNFCTSKVFLL